MTAQEDSSHGHWHFSSCAYSGMASCGRVGRRHVARILHRACDQPLPEPTKIRSRAHQFLILVVFVPLWQCLISALTKPLEPSKAAIKALLSPS